ncbi:MAG: AAA family ATPase [Ignavibacteriaceae bacterium]
MKIEKFHITNFRSLVDFKIDSFANTTIFYGLNNAGKSNILKSLVYIFERKPLFEKEVFTPVKNFYGGLIKDFKNNFYNIDNSLEIKFEVGLSIEKGELPVAKSIVRLLKKWPDNYSLNIVGVIRKSNIDEDVAEISVSNITVEDKIIYNSENIDGRYFPSLLNKDKTNASELNSAFENYIDKLNDCIYIIDRNRDMLPATFDYANKSIVSVSAETFKSNLFSLYLNDQNHLLFERINKIFNSSPFSFGTISFSRNNSNNLEIMIKEGDIRLPISYLGSSVSQILFIISSIIQKSKRIVCIEELEQNLSPELQTQSLVKLQLMIGQDIDQLIISSHSPVFAKPDKQTLIYLIEKANLKSEIAEIMGDEYGEEMKKLWIHAAPPLNTYTQDEMDAYYKKSYEDIKRIGEDNFNR